jgi:hypothetical protein
MINKEKQKVIILGAAAVLCGGLVVVSLNGVESNLLKAENTTKSCGGIYFGTGTTATNKIALNSGYTATNMNIDAVSSFNCYANGSDNAMRMGASNGYTSRVTFSFSGLYNISAIKITAFMGSTIDSNNRTAFLYEDSAMTGANDYTYITSQEVPTLSETADASVNVYTFTKNHAISNFTIGARAGDQIYVCKIVLTYSSFTPLATKTYTKIASLSDFNSVYNNVLAKRFLYVSSAASGASVLGVTTSSNYRQYASGTVDASSTITYASGMEELVIGRLWGSASINHYIVSTTHSSTNGNLACGSTGSFSVSNASDLSERWQITIQSDGQALLTNVSNSSYHIVHDSTGVTTSSSSTSYGYLYVQNY